MKEVRCPYCGRENTRGKFCMFCGNPLSGGKSIAQSGGAEKEQDQRWDPEKVYQRSRGRRVVAVLLAAVLCIAAAVTIYSAQTFGGVRSARSFQPPLGTPGASGLGEMTEMLSDSGMITFGEARQLGNEVYQQFGPFVILNETSSYSTALEKNDGALSLVHVLDDERGRYYTIYRPGPVFQRLLDRLTEQYGKPAIRGAQDYYYWEKDGDMLALYYGYDNSIHIEYHTEVSAASV